MINKAVFSVKLDAELHNSFIVEAEAAKKPPTEIMQELIQDFVDQRLQSREYADFLQAKVDSARSDKQSGQTYSHEHVEREFASMREELLSKD